MLFKHKRFIALFMICAVLFFGIQFNSLRAAATEDTSSTETTTTTASTTTTTTTTTTTAATTTTTTAAAQNGVEITQVYCYGSNNKLYNQVIKFSAVSESYTANVSIPLWMTSCQINIKSVSGATVTYDDTEFEANGSVYTHTFTFDAASKYKTNTYKIKIKKGDKESTLTFNLTQTTFETKLESVAVDSVNAEGSNADGYTYTLPTGTTSCRIKLKTRSEEKVTLGKAGEEAKTLELTSDKIFLEKVELTEGENVFNITVSAPGTTISTTLTITVGEAVVSSEVSSETVEDEPFVEDISYTDVPEEIIESSEPEVVPTVSTAKSDTNSTSPIIWILIGIVIAVVIGACIFMIASMGGSKKSSANTSRGYNNYRTPAPAPARRRDLGRYVDDDYGYDDYYEEQPERYPDDGYYQDEGFYEEDGYYQDGDYYNDYGRQETRDNYQQRYERQPQRQQYQSQRRGNRNDYDDFYDDYYN